jgi:hypothetical protein
VVVAKKTHIKYTRYLEIDPALRSRDDFRPRIKFPHERLDALDFRFRAEVDLVEEDDVGELDLVNEEVGHVAVVGGVEGAAVCFGLERKKKR